MTLEKSKRISVEALLQEAGDILLDYWQKEDGFHAEEKADGSLITEADLASNQHLAEGLKSVFGDYNIRSEEEEIQYCSDSASTWVFDPLDGTTLFANGEKDFAILLSLIDDGNVVDAYMYYPVYERMIEAHLSEGVQENGRGLELQSPATPLKKGCIYFRGGEHLTDNEFLLHERVDSQQAFYKLIKGELSSVILHMEKLGDWDIAAPCLILKELGAIVTDNNNAPIVFSTKPYDVAKASCDYFIASTTQEVHKTSLRLMSN